MKYFKKLWGYIILAIVPIGFYLYSLYMFFKTFNFDYIMFSGLSFLLAIKYIDDIIEVKYRLDNKH